MAKVEEKETKKPQKRKATKKIVKNEEKIVSKEKEEKKVLEKKEEKKILEKNENKEVEKNSIKKKKTFLTTSYNVKDGLIIMVLSIVIGIAIGVLITEHNNGKNIKELKEFSDTYRSIEKNHIDKIDKSGILVSSLNGLVSGLNDRYAIFNTSKTSIINYEEGIEGSFNGLGVMISLNEEGRILIVDVFGDSPAAKSGILIGDIINKMNDEYYDINNYDDFSYNIKTAKKGKKFNFEISRNDEILNIEVETDLIEVQSVYKNVEERDNRKVGIFTINNFANNTYDQFVKLYNEAKEEGIDSLVIDIRCNAEGSMENAAKVASLFLEKDAIIYQTVKDGEYEKVINKEDKVVDLPVVVIINGGTISTGEMFASSLNENLNTPLIGEITFGKGYLQEMLPLSNGRNVLHTTSEWVTSRGTKVEGIGISPSIEIINAEGEIDYQLSSAIDRVLMFVGE